MGSVVTKEGFNEATCPHLGTFWTFLRSVLSQSACPTLANSGAGFASGTLCWRARVCGVEQHRRIHGEGRAGVGAYLPQWNDQVAGIFFLASEADVVARDEEHPWHVQLVEGRPQCAARVAVQPLIQRQPECGPVTLVLGTRIQVSAGWMGVGTGAQAGTQGITLPDCPQDH